MTNDKLLHKWLNNTLSAEELEIFQKRPEYDSLSRVYKHTENLSSPKLNTEAMLQTILASPKSTALTKSKGSTLNPPRTSTILKKKSKSFSKWMKAGIAASILVLAGYLVMAPTAQDMVNIQLAAGQVKSGKFPDDSRFVLSGNSTLSYDNNSWHKARTVNLKGEANFSVYKGEPFKVMTTEGSIEVLGTKFTVISRDGHFEVKCKEGSVLVKTKKGHTEEVLKPGEMLSIDNDGTFINLRENISRFKNAPLKDAMTVMEKKFRIVFYNTEIDTEQILTCNFQHKNLNQALKTTMTPLGIKYETFGNGQIRIFK